MTALSDREERIERLASWLYGRFHHVALRTTTMDFPTWNHAPEFVRDWNRAVATELIDDPPDEIFDWHTVG